jgi:hypothetical protein
MALKPDCPSGFAWLAHAQQGNCPDFAGFYPDCRLLRFGPLGSGKAQVTAAKRLDPNRTAGLEKASAFIAAFSISFTRLLG